jgi:hypothetical protein
MYNILVTMMTDGFARVLGGKIGKVVEIGDVHNNYKRVRIDFPLEKALVPSVQQRVKGHGTMDFIVRYENVPFFALPVIVLVMHNENVLMGMMRRGLFTLARFYVALHRRKRSVYV